MQISLLVTIRVKWWGEEKNSWVGWKQAPQARGLFEEKPQNLFWWIQNKASLRLQRTDPRTVPTTQRKMSKSCISATSYQPALVTGWSQAHSGFFQHSGCSTTLYHSNQRMPLGWGLVFCSTFSFTKFFSSLATCMFPYLGMKFPLVLFRKAGMLFLLPL